MTRAISIRLLKSVSQKRPQLTVVTRWTRLLTFSRGSHDRELRQLRRTEGGGLKPALRSSQYLT